MYQKRMAGLMESDRQSKEKRIGEDKTQVVWNEELTKKYGLHFANGKERVKIDRLREPDKTKYELYQILKTEVGRCGSS